jgi:large subunit ribosomal protein L6
MSRVGKKIIEVPQGVNITISDGNMVTVKGPRGTLARQFDPELRIEQEDGTLSLVRPNDERHNRAMHGLSRALLNKMVTGVSSGYEKRL